MTLLEAWQRTLRADPQAPAIIDAGTGAYHTRAEVAAAARTWQPARGSEAGRAIFFSEPNGLAWVAALLAILARGRVAAAVDPGEPPGTVQRLARRTLRLPRAAEIIKLTSGSSGGARALPFTGAQMLADGAQVCATMGIQSSDTNLGLIPFGHSYGLGNLVVPLLRQGTAVVVGVPPLPHAIAAAAAAHQVTVFPTVPAVLRALAEADLSAGLPPLRLVISAGAPLSPELAAAFEHRFGLRPRNFYGSTETGGIAYDRSGEATLSGRAIGRPLRGVRLSFAPGRRFVVTSAAVCGRGRFRPADRGELNGRGELVLLGRTDRVLKIAGRRLDPAEVESALRALPGIRDAWVSLHPLRRDALAAVYVGAPAAAELGERLRTTLASWKIPRKWVQLEALPLTARGKTDRAALERLLR